MGPEHDAVLVREIADAIHHYVLAYPDAADSIDGIHHWWLLPRLREEAPAFVEAAVRLLVMEGVLQEVVLEDGRVIYSNAQRRR